MSHIRFCDESVYQHQDANDARDRQEEEPEEEQCYRTELHSVMTRNQTDCFNERQQRWEEEVASQRQHEDDDVVQEASEMGVELGQWGMVIDQYDHLALSYQQNAWINQDSFFYFENIWLCV